MTITAWRRASPWSYDQLAAILRRGRPDVGGALAYNQWWAQVSLFVNTFQQDPTFDWQRFEIEALKIEEPAA